MTYRPNHGKFESSVERWRAQAEWYHFDSASRERVEWMIFYHAVAGKNAKRTAEYFGISRKTFHKWLKRFNPLDVLSLESSSRRPHTLRRWEVTEEEEANVTAIRTQHLCWGKAKLKVLYKKIYGQEISTWKIERVVRKHRLYPDPVSHTKYIKKRKHSRKRVRIHTLDTSRYEPGKLWHVDSVELNWYGQKRYIVTGLEDKTKLAYARIYPTHASKYAADFLKRLVYLSNGDISVVHSDNGSEFAGHFQKASQELAIFQVYSRVRTPNDNPASERFNRTLQEEWLNMSETGLDNISEANLDLTDWLVEYNSVRPHASLDYQTPLEYAHAKYFQVLPMYPAHTKI